MEDWQIAAIAEVKLARDDFIAHINKCANSYIDDISGDEKDSYNGIKSEHVMNWMWESA